MSLDFPPPASPPPLGPVAGIVRLLRPHQWVKNAFVLAPLVFSGEFLRPAAVADAVLATILFCVGASAAYIVNDWHDIENDRRHPVKRHRRPMASGAVSKPAAAALLAALYGLLALGSLVLPGVVAVIVAYLLINVAYSLALKHQPVLDIFIVASGFVLRVLAGTQALSVPISAWMFVTTLCLALYLASIKRRQELLRSGSETRKVLQHYTVPLVERYAEMSATGALVFYSLFVLAEKPELIITIPLVLFGLFRYWYVVEALGQGESPTDALFADYQLIGAIVLWVVACIWILWPG